MTTFGYVENMIDSAKKLLGLKNEFSKAEGHRINIQKSTVFLYVSSEQSEIKI